MDSRFVYRFAVGANGLRYSGEWRVWTAKRKPDLHLGVRKVAGQFKATVHAPWPPHEGWERHCGYPMDATGEVARHAKANGGPHKVRWSGCELAPGWSLEFRVIIRHQSLEQKGVPATNETQLLPIPLAGEYGEVGVLLGPPGSREYPRERDGASQLLAEGEMVDGRRVLVVYAVRAITAVPGRPDTSAPDPSSGKGFVDPNADLANGRFRAVAIDRRDDGSLQLFDLKATFRSKET